MHHHCSNCILDAAESRYLFTSGQFVGRGTSSSTVADTIANLVHAGKIAAEQPTPAVQSAASRGADGEGYGSSSLVSMTAPNAGGGGNFSCSSRSTAATIGSAWK